MANVVCIEPSSVSGSCITSSSVSGSCVNPTILSENPWSDCFTEIETIGEVNGTPIPGLSEAAIVDILSGPNSISASLGAIVVNRPVWPSEFTLASYSGSATNNTASENRTCLSGHSYTGGYSASEDDSAEIDPGGVSFVEHSFDPDHANCWRPGYKNGSNFFFLGSPRFNPDPSSMGTAGSDPPSNGNLPNEFPLGGLVSQSALFCAGPLESPIYDSEKKWIQEAYMIPDPRYDYDDYVSVWEDPSPTGSVDTSGTITVNYSLTSLTIGAYSVPLMKIEFTWEGPAWTSTPSEQPSLPTLNIPTASLS